MQEIIRLVATNDRGMRIGEYHQNSNLSDKEVDQIRDLHEFAGWSYRDIARAYGASKSCIAEICRYEKRNQTVFDWKKVRVIPGKKDEVVKRVDEYASVGITKSEAKRLTELAPKVDHPLKDRAGWAKISRALQIEIKKMFRDGISVSQILKKFDVSRKTIEGIVRSERGGLTYKGKSYKSNRSKVEEVDA